MTHYLYGASIQGIQGFIFETNKLKEIIGASEIVEQLSTNKFNAFLKRGTSPLPDNKDYIMQAAGNIRLLTKNKDTVEYIVKYWQKEVDKQAPGITVSQAVVSFKDKLSKEKMDKLEQKLKSARNKAVISADIAPMAAVRSRRTGKPAVDWGDDNNAPRDRGNKQKQVEGHKMAPYSLMGKCINETDVSKTNHYPFNISDIIATNNQANNQTGWLAVIHADGNSLGKIIQGMSEKLEKDDGDIKKAYSSFSKALNKSTEDAVQDAVNKIVIPAFEKSKNKKYPFRPVIIGGDDLTVVIRADLALDFTIEFLKNFQNKTKANLKSLIKDFKLNNFKKGLTACAGIAYMKDSYPFHYTVNLAEELCADAKKHSKKVNDINVPASIAFHKIQDSFVDSYLDIIERELTPTDNISFKFGPYFIDKPHLPSTDNLKENIKNLMESESPKSGIRKWLGYLHGDINNAKMWMKRVIEITDKKYIEKLQLNDVIEKTDTDVPYKTALYDIMSLSSIMSKEG